MSIRHLVARTGSCSRSYKLNKDLSRATRTLQLFRTSPAVSSSSIHRPLNTSTSANGSRLANTTTTTTTTIMNPDPDIQRVLAFWFDRNPLDWIVAPEGFDAQCESELGDLVRKARRHELDDWASATAATPEEGSLALAVLLDQLPRNLFRGTADAFASDAQAWEVATRAIARGLDKKVPVVRASAFYMPLLQRESLISAVAARALSEALVPRAWAPEEQKWVAMGVAGAERHVEQIARFGRYPTRNAVLGRESTEAEVEFLKGHTFSLPSDS